MESDVDKPTNQLTLDDDIVSFSKVKEASASLRKLVAENEDVLQPIIPHTIDHCQQIERDIVDSLVSDSPEAGKMLRTLESGLVNTVINYESAINKLLKDPWQIGGQQSGEVFELQILRQLHELQAFCGHQSQPLSLIKDAHAMLWWRRAFGDSTFVVPWDEFFDQLCVVFTEHASVLKAIEPLLGPLCDFCFDQKVSTFEFQTFLKWFGPFDRVVENVSRLAQHGAFFGYMTWEKAESLLSGREIGTYIVRFSRRSLGNFALDVCTSSQRHPVRHALYEREKYGGSFILDAVNAHQAVYKSPFRTSLDEDISSRYTGYRPYASFESGVEYVSSLCQICLHRPATTALIPCLHVLCDECARSWLPGHSCPFCRQGVSSLIDASRVRQSEMDRHVAV